MLTIVIRLDFANDQFFVSANFSQLSELSGHANELLMP